MSRNRLTITLKNDLLKRLDSAIDGDRLRNRSHAIEFYLSKALGLGSVKVLILAGGKPVYFESEKKSLPKAMVKIAGKPLLEHTLLRLKSQKFTEIIISLGEGGEIIKNYFKDGSALGMNISYLQQKGAVLGTARPVLESRNYFKDGAFLLIYGDVLTDLNFWDLVEFHRLQKNTVCTMALTSTQVPNQWGLTRLQGNKVVEYEEKPKNPKTFSHLVNAGVYVLESQIFKYIPPLAAKLESDVFPRLAEEGKITGYPYEGLWLDISSSAAYRQAIKEISKF